WGSPVSLMGKSTLTKRVLIKENFGYSLCSQCYSYSADPTTGQSSFGATSADIYLNVGDIQEYYDNGSVIYEARINNGSWVELDPSNNKEVLWQERVGGRDYYAMIIPAMIQYYPNSGQLFIGSHRMLYAPGLYTMDQLKYWMNSEL